MAYYGELTTLADVHAYLTDTTNTAHDPTYLALIRSVSRDMEATSNRHFSPRVLTQLYNTPEQAPWSARAEMPRYESVMAGGFGHARRHITLDDDLLEVTTLLNGDGSTITAADYLLEPANATPKELLKLKRSSSVVWLLNSSGESEQVISLTGIFGWHDDYANAWVQSLATIHPGITAAATAVPLSTGGSALLKAGQLIKMGSEFAYISAIPSTDNLTLVRGVNGSTAAIHADLTDIYTWSTPSIEIICRTGVIAMARLRDNPVGESVRVGEAVFTTPKDVRAWLNTQLAALGLLRLGMA